MLTLLGQPLLSFTFARVRELLSSGHLRPNPKPQHRLPAAAGKSYLISLPRATHFVRIYWLPGLAARTACRDGCVRARRLWSPPLNYGHSLVHSAQHRVKNKHLLRAPWLCVCALPLRLKPLKNNFFSPSNNMSRPRAVLNQVFCVWQRENFHKNRDALENSCVTVQLIPIPLSNWPSNDFRPRRFIVFGTAVNEIASLMQRGGFPNLLYRISSNCIELK